MPEFLEYNNSTDIAQDWSHDVGSAIFKDIIASIYEEIDNYWVLDMTELDNQRVEYRNFFKKTRPLLKSERIFWDMFWISTINRKLITNIIDSSDPPWDILMWAEHIPKSFYPIIIKKIKDYCEINLEKIYHSHVMSMTFSRELSHLSMFPETFLLMNQIVVSLPPKLSYQIYSGISKNYESLLSVCLARQARQYFPNMPERQKVEFVLSTVYDGHFEEIFPWMKEKIEANNLILEYLLGEWKKCWSYFKNKIATASLLILSNNPELTHQPLEKLTSRLFPDIENMRYDERLNWVALWEVQQQEYIDFSDSVNFINWKPFVMYMVFSSDSDGKRSFKIFLIRMKERWWFPEYEEWEVVFSIGSIQLFINNPNYISWKDFFSEKNKLHKTGEVDITVVRWHTTSINEFADNVFNVWAKLLVLWGCVWATTLVKDIVYPKLFSLNENVKSISKTLCIAPIRIWRSKNNDQIIMDIIEQFNIGCIQIDLKWILWKTNGEYQSFRISLPELLWDILKSIDE